MRADKQVSSPFDITIIFPPGSPLSTQFYTSKNPFLALNLAYEFYDSMHATWHINRIPYLEVPIPEFVAINVPSRGWRDGMHS